MFAICLTGSLVGAFKDLLFSPPKIGGMIQFDLRLCFFQMGVAKNHQLPTSYFHKDLSILFQPANCKVCMKHGNFNAVFVDHSIPPIQKNSIHSRIN